MRFVFTSHQIQVQEAALVKKSYCAKKNVTSVCSTRGKPTCPHTEGGPLIKASKEHWTPTCKSNRRLKRDIEPVIDPYFTLHTLGHKHACFGCQRNTTTHMYNEGSGTGVLRHPPARSARRRVLSPRSQNASLYMCVR